VSNVKTVTKTKRLKMTKGKVEAVGGDMWRYMKKTHALTEQQIFNLKVATCPAKVDNVGANLIRIFDSDAAKEKGMTIENYESLNEHPELILYEGYKVPGRGGELVIEKRNGAGTSVLEKKLNEGAVTDIGVIIEKTGAAKFMSGFGHFLLMGGFLVILVLIVAIIFIFSVALNGC
jgi:hypothetical protein